MNNIDELKKVRELIYQIAVLNGENNMPIADWAKAALIILDKLIDQSVGNSDNVKCPACGGNDFDMACAYPREHERREGCLRTKRLEQQSKGVDESFPRGAIENGRAFIERFEQMDTTSASGSYEFGEIKRCFNYMADYLLNLPHLSLSGGDADHERVNIPVHENEAAMMVLLGTDWLEKHAPHRLKAQPKAPTVSDELVRELAHIIYDSPNTRIAFSTAENCVRKILTRVLERGVINGEG